jgi:hypothetical protein
MDEASGTYWGGSYFLDCNLLVLENGLERLRRTTDSSFPIGNSLGTPAGVIGAEGNVITIEAYAFFSSFPPPATGTSTLTLRFFNDGEQIYTNTISYNPGGSEPASISTTFTVVRNVYYLIEAFTTYTPVSAPATPSITPTITPTRTVTPTITPSPSPPSTPPPTATPSVTPPNSPPESPAAPYQVQQAYIQSCGGFNTCEDGALVTVEADFELTNFNYYYTGGNVYRIISNIFGSSFPADYSLGIPSDVTGGQNSYCCIEF